MVGIPTGPSVKEEELYSVIYGDSNRREKNYWEKTHLTTALSARSSHELVGIEPSPLSRKASN
jgi:hypothetical protein